MANTYRELTAWQKAFSLCLDTYWATRLFPKSEAYGLAAQMQRAAVSVPSNIAYGSICELQTQIMLATELGYLEREASGSLLQSSGDVERLTKAFIRSLEKKRLAH